MTMRSLSSLLKRTLIERINSHHALKLNQTRFLSNSFSSIPLESDDDLEQSKQDDLKTKIFKLRFSKRSVTTLLEKWVADGNNRNIARDLNKSQRYKHALEGQYVDDLMESKRDTSDSLKEPPGRNVSKKDKIKFLVDTFLGLKESKEAVYGALDAWVAWEKTFPVASLRIAMGTLEKEQEWHRVIQVIKWILSKGQGNTMGMYRQLINALDMDHRTEEAHNFWIKKIGNDLHSVPWTLCSLMISIYYRNNMMERLVKLFKGLEAFDRKPPEKSIVQKVANAYEMLGLLEEKNRVLDKFNDLFTDTWRGHPKKSKKTSGKKLEKPVERIQTGNSDNQQSTKDDAEFFSYNQESNRKALIDKLQQIQSVV